MQYGSALLPQVFDQHLGLQPACNQYNGGYTGLDEGANITKKIIGDTELVNPPRGLHPQSMQAGAVVLRRKGRNHGICSSRHSFGSRQQQGERNKCPPQTTPSCSSSRG